MLRQIVLEALITCLPNQLAIFCGFGFLSN
jgi:hypothetical protein